jgi:allantoate deiminase
VNAPDAKAFDPKAMGARAQEMIDTLAEISAEPGRLTRLFLTPEHRQAADLVAAWMERAGLEVRMDAAATVHGLLPAKARPAHGAERDGHLSPGAAPLADGPHATDEAPLANKRLLVGSHIDTVVDAGRYDGNLGVVAGIMAVEEIHARGITLPFDLEILAFGDEEGCRFAKTLMSSSTIAGALDTELLDTADDNGITVRDALRKFGGEPDNLAGEAYRPSDALGYLELHIEQGPVLDREGEALGVVSAIAGQGRYRIQARGEAGHAGTVPMTIRHDALAASAEAMMVIEEVARKHAGAAMVATVGDIGVTPGASNVIPGTASFSLDLRAADDIARETAMAEIRNRLRQIGARRGVVIGIETTMEKPVVAVGPRLKAAIARGIADVTGRAPRELMSGAGHDGQAMAHLTEIGMIFVRCRAGISHNPLEYVTVEDMGLAVEALIRTILELARDEEG